MATYQTASAEARKAAEAAKKTDEIADKAWKDFLRLQNTASRAEDKALEAKHAARRAAKDVLGAKDGNEWEREQEPNDDGWGDLIERIDERGEGKWFGLEPVRVKGNHSSTGAKLCS